MPAGPSSARSLRKAASRGYISASTPGGSPEIGRHVRFRDWLRAHPADRELYERVKRELASRRWTYLQQYADAKTEVIATIMARIEAEPDS